MYPRFPDKRFMPVALDIYKKRILIVGGGKIAMHKIVPLQKYDAEIFVVSREVSEDIKNAGIPFVEKDYSSSDLVDAHIVYTCTNDRELNKKIRNDSHERNILVNVVDDPELCDFVSPAIYRDGYISVAVSSNGEDVMKSIEVRNKIRDFLDSEKTVDKV